MELIEKNLRPREILTRKAFENAATVVAASGGPQMQDFICRLWQLNVVSNLTYTMWPKFSNEPLILQI